MWGIFENVSRGVGNEVCWGVGEMRRDVKRSVGKCAGV